MSENERKPVQVPFALSLPAYVRRCLLAVYGCCRLTQLHTSSKCLHLSFHRSADLTGAKYIGQYSKTLRRRSLCRGWGEVADLVFISEATRKALTSQLPWKHKSSSRLLHSGPQIKQSSKNPNVFLVLRKTTGAIT